jgi:ribosomal subunit interface protein
MPSINIKATHTVLSEEMSEYVAKKLKTIQDFLHEENNVHVELEAEPKHHSGPKYSVEITIMPKPGIYASAAGQDFHEAFDLCIAKIKEQLLKKKDKMISLRRRSKIR